MFIPEQENPSGISQPAIWHTSFNVKNLKFFQAREHEWP